MSGSVLIVDDDPDFRRLAHRMFVSAGLTVVGEAEDARTAVEVALASRPAGILVDVNLPDRNGIDLARELLELDWHPRVLLTSSDADYVDLIAAHGQGELAFVPKEDLPNAPLQALLVP
jgi:DNA-binding NarL/FixJ family response regulator